MNLLPKDALCVFMMRNEFIAKCNFVCLHDDKYIYYNHEQKFIYCDHINKYIYYNHEQKFIYCDNVNKYIYRTQNE